jgi:hypothetical protein
MNSSVLMEVKVARREDDARNIAAQTGLYWKFTNDDSRSGHRAEQPVHGVCVHTPEVDVFTYILMHAK